jgi:hypothetical protein
MSKHDNYRVKQTVKKVEAGSYKVYAGDVLVGHVDLTGQYGYDNYPWSWWLVESEDSLSLATEGLPSTSTFIPTPKWQGQEESKKVCLDVMWHRAGLA